MLLIISAIIDCAMYITIKTSTGMTIETNIENYKKKVFILCTKMFIEKWLHTLSIQICSGFILTFFLPL